MKLVKTSVTESHVWLRFADNDDAAKAKEWIDVQAPVAALKAPPKKLGMFAQADVDWGLEKAPPPVSLGKPSSHQLRVVQVAALRHVKALIDEQIKALGT